MCEELIATLPRYGVSNGTSLGRHMGIMDVAADAIVALQAENAEKDKEIERLRFQRPVQVDGDVMALTLELAETKAALTCVEAERDALVALINKSALKPIEECKHYEKCYRDAADKMRMMQCIVCNHWQWRGAQGEA